MLATLTAPLFASLVTTLRTPLSFLLVIGILVFVHEFGHYLAARLVGCKIEAFAIGFGRPIVKWTDRTGTAWQIGWIPIGGYVRIHGFERADLMAPEDRAALIPGRAYQNKPVAARALVAAAGPAANFLLTFLLFLGLFLAVGLPRQTTQVLQVLPNHPAAAAGIARGDIITGIAGTPVTDFAALQRVTSAHPGQTVPVRLTRAGKPLTLSVTLGAVPGPHGGKIGELGIAGGAVAYRATGPVGAVMAAARQSWAVVAQTAHGLWQLVTGHANPADLGGALRIAQLSGQEARLGLASFVSFIAIISVNLGLLNLVPIPVLDGGHLFFLALEAVRGRPVPPRYYEAGMRAGIGIVAVLLIFSAVNDLGHFGLFHWLRHAVG